MRRSGADTATTAPAERLPGCWAAHLLSVCRWRRDGRPTRVAGECRSRRRADSQARISTRFIGPIRFENSAVSAGPTIAPAVPPAEMKPYKRRASSVFHRSAMKLQNTETANRLNTRPNEKRDRRLMNVLPDSKTEAKTAPGCWRKTDRQPAGASVEKTAQKAGQKSASKAASPQTQPKTATASCRRRREFPSRRGQAAARSS